jgi:beta-mannanase
MKEEEEKSKDLQRRSEQGYNIYQGPTGSQAGFEAGTQAALAAAPAAIKTGNPLAAAGIIAAAGLSAGTQAASKAEQDARKARAQQAKKEDAEQIRTAKAASAQLNKEGEMAASAFEEDEDAMLSAAMYDPNAGESQYTKWFRENFA